MNAELTLEKAKTAIRQKEAVTVQNSTLKDDGDNKDASLDAFNRFPPRSGRGGGARGGRSSKPQMQSCTRCGYERHAPGARCPAMQSTCHNCNRKGHYATFCYSKTQASNSKLNLDSSYLDTLTWIQSQTSHPLGTAPSKCKVYRYPLSWIQGQKQLLLVKNHIGTSRKYSCKQPPEYYRDLPDNHLKSCDSSYLL